MSSSEPQHPSAPTRHQRNPVTLIRSARLVPVAPVGATGPRPAPPDSPVDIRIVGGTVAEVGPGLAVGRPDLVVDAGGRWAVPGLWDQHVHLAQWAQSRTRLDVSGTAHPDEVVGLVRDHLAQLPDGAGGSLVVGSGYRSATWPERPTVAALDAASGDHPVVLVSGDAHNGWLNSRGRELLGVPPGPGVLDESDWFPVLTRLAEVPGASAGWDEAYARAVAAAAALGVVGVVDMEFGPGYRDWPERFGRGVTQLRVRAATYPDRLSEVVAAGLRTGDDLPGGDGLLTMGPLKIISDGSLNTRTASCWEPYADAGPGPFPRGKQLYGLAELTDLLERASRHGLEIALHAIGDAAVTTALDAFAAATGAVGAIEHAQLVRPGDVDRMARLGIRASVQPAHLLDDRDVTAQCWPDRADRCFPLGSMLRAGVTLALGSDAPVAPLDPWLAMAAAVHRSADEREPWNPAEALTPAQALAASTDGQTTVAAGHRGDVALLDHDPLADGADSAAAATQLRRTTVAATFVAGRLTHLTI